MYFHLTWLVPPPIRIGPQFGAFRLRGFGHSSQRDRNALLPFWKGDENLVPPDFQPQRQVILRDEVSVVDGRIASLDAVVRVIDRRPRVHLSRFT